LKGYALFLIPERIYTRYATLPKNRQRYLDYQHYYSVFDRSGNATTTILINGKVMGIWDIDREEQVVKVFMLENSENEISYQIETKLLAMGKFITGKPIKMKTVSKMLSLNERPAGAFMSPLKGN